MNDWACQSWHDHPFTCGMLQKGAFWSVPQLSQLKFRISLKSQWSWWGKLNKPLSLSCSCLSILFYLRWTRFPNLYVISVVAYTMPCGCLVLKCDSRDSLWHQSKKIFKEKQMLYYPGCTNTHFSKKDLQTQLVFLTSLEELTASSLQKLSELSVQDK